MQRSCTWEASDCMQMTVAVGLQAFQTAEELEAEDSWFCSKCKRHVQANKKLDLWAVPEVLVVHLKRFFFTRARRDKLDVQVDFPLENWDLSNYLPHHQVRLSCCCVTMFAGLLWLLRPWSLLISAPKGLVTLRHLVVMTARGANILRRR